MSDSRPNIVVVGVGGAGIHLARQLSATLDPQKFNLILINARPYFTHLLGAVRASVTTEGNIGEKILMPLDKVLTNGNGTIIFDEVMSITEEDAEKGGYLTLKSGEKIKYTVLVLTPGSHWDGPLALPDTKDASGAWFKTWQAKFEKAEDILLVGGGAIGTEYAGEIKDLNPIKRVTLIHNNPLPLNPAYPDKFRNTIAQGLRARGVELILDDSISEEDLKTAGEVSGPTTITTTNGRTLKPDLIVSCRGPRPRTAFISASLGADCLTSAGYIKTLPTFQIPGHPHIFAAGDIVDLPEQRQIGKYGGHATVIVKNIISLLSSQTPTNEYKGAYEIIAITIGKEGGATYLGILWGITLGNWVTAKLKSRGLLLSKMRGFLGLTP